MTKRQREREHKRRQLLAQAWDDLRYACGSEEEYDIQLDLLQGSPEQTFRQELADIKRATKRLQESRQTANT